MELRKTLCCSGHKVGHLWVCLKEHADCTGLRKIVVRQALHCCCSEGLVGSCPQVLLRILAGLVGMEVLGELNSSI
jgi:hypothetical protein